MKKMMKIRQKTFPLGYYFINELVAADRKHLLENVIAIATRCGIKITNLTFDGHSANVPACELLGAKLNVNVKGNNRQFKPFIINPINDEKIYIILDPSHMEKLVRNRLASCEVSFDSNGNKIEWRYILQLYEFSNKNDFHAHKLTKKHIEWKQNAMNVRLAAETFSESVAGCIEFLMKQKFPGFEGAQATIDFIRRMDRLFNVFNSTQSNDKNIYKRPLSPENKRIIFDFIQDTTEFFRSLRVEEVFYKKLPKGGRNKKSKRVISKKEVLPILHTKHKTAFRGFIIAMASLKAMYEEYVEKEQFIMSISTYYLLQDVLEMLFGRIRQCGGYNNNPNVYQFKGAFRKILCNMKMELSTRSNCRMFDINLPDDLFFSNIYFVSSKRARITMDEETYKNQKDSVLENVGAVYSLDLELIGASDSVNAMTSNHHMFDITSQFMLLYSASKIEKKIMECKSFHCHRCRLVFEENEKVDTANTSSLYSGYSPCKSTTEICKTAEQFFKLYDGHETTPRYDFKVLYCLIFRCMNLDALYPDSKFECNYSHKYQFIKCVVGQYLTMRATHIAKQVTLQRQDKIIRQQYNRLVNFKGQ